MPRNVRNVWIDATIDGRDTKLSGGPVSKDGGARINLYQRNDGNVETALTIHTIVRSDGKTIETRVYDADHKIIHEVVTQR